MSFEVFQAFLLGQVELAFFAESGGKFGITGHGGSFQHDGGIQQRGGAGHTGSLSEGSLYRVVGEGGQHALTGQIDVGFFTGHELHKAERFVRMLAVLADRDEGAQTAGAHDVAGGVEGGQVGHVPVRQLDALSLVVLQHGDGPFAVDQHTGGAQAEELQPVDALGSLLREAHVALVHVHNIVPDADPFLYSGQIVIQQVGAALIGRQGSTEPVSQETAPVLGAVFFIGQLLGQLTVLVPGDLFGIGDALLVEEGLVVVQGVQGAAVGHAVVLVFEQGLADDGAIGAHVDAGGFDAILQGQQTVQRDQIQHGGLAVATDQIHHAGVGRSQHNDLLIVVIVVDEGGNDLNVGVLLVEHVDQGGHIALLIGPAVVVEGDFLSAFGGTESQRHDRQDQRQQNGTDLFHCEKTSYRICT